MLLFIVCIVYCALKSCTENLAYYYYSETPLCRTPLGNEILSLGWGVLNSGVICMGQPTVSFIQRCPYFRGVDFNFLANGDPEAIDTFEDVAASPNDPVFILHHNMLDCVLIEWLRRHPGTSYPRDVWHQDMPETGTLCISSLYSPIMSCLWTQKS